MELFRLADVAIMAKIGISILSIVVIYSILNAMQTPSLQQKFFYKKKLMLKNV